MKDATGRDPIDSLDDLSLLRLQTKHLERIRLYVAVIVIMALLGVIGEALWLFGAIEVTTQSSGRGF